MAEGVRFVTVEPVNEMTAYDFLPGMIVCIADENPAAFQNRDSILGAADRIILCEHPHFPTRKLFDLVRAGRTVLITCTADASREWLAFCHPYQERLVAICTRELDS